MENRKKQPAPMDRRGGLPTEVREILGYARMLEAAILNMDPATRRRMQTRLRSAQDMLNGNHPRVQAEIANFLQILEQRS